MDFNAIASSFRWSSGKAEAVVRVAVRGLVYSLQAMVFGGTG